MPETIAFDALTAAAIGQHLEARHLRAGLVVELMLQAARDQRQTSRHGIVVKITGWTAKGPPIIPDGDSGVMTMKVEMPAQATAGQVSIIGSLARGTGGLRFTIREMGLSNALRFVRSGKGLITLELRQLLPDTLIGGAGVLVGRPLRDVVGHPALDRPEAAGIKVTTVGPPTVRNTTRIGVPMGGSDGLDVVIDAGDVEVRA